VIAVGATALRSYFLRLFCVLGCLVVFSACHKTGDEEQIKHVTDSMASAVQSGNFGEITAHLHPDFRANNEMDAQQVKQMLMFAGIQHAAISITIVSAKTDLDTVYHDRASSTLSVIATSGTSFAGLPKEGSAHIVKLEWRKDGDDWKILRALWDQ